MLRLGAVFGVPIRRAIDLTSRAVPEVVAGYVPGGGISPPACRNRDVLLALATNGSPTKGNGMLTVTRKG